MILYEFEGKELLQQAGISVPLSDLVVNLNDQPSLKSPAVLKAQVLSGKRADAGGIIIAENQREVDEGLKNLYGTIINQEKVEKILVEEKINYIEQYYVSISYDTDCRSSLLTISSQGGTGVENQQVQTFIVDPLNPLLNLLSTPISEDILQKLITLFFAQDCLLLEINPLVKTSEGAWIALDAKIKLDDLAVKRHGDWGFSSRGVPGYIPSEREVEAKKIDQNDYRGVAGSTYFDLEGDIAILASGGGASMTAMDALLLVGGKAANYTEYGGNPPKEKVEKLTEIVLSKPGLNGLWVVGAVANFTNIYETLSGFIEGLRQARVTLGNKLDFPIVIRRGGPHDKEAFAMLAEVKDFDLHLFGEETSIAKSAEIMTQLAKEYQEKASSKQGGLI